MVVAGQCKGRKEDLHAGDDVPLLVNSIGDPRLRELLFRALDATAVLRVQLRVFVRRNLVIPRLRAGLVQLDLVGKLNRGKVGDVFVDGPEELILSVIILHLEAVICCTQSGGIVTEIVHVSFGLGGKLRAANRQLQRIRNKLKLAAHLVLDRGVFADGVEDVITDARKVNIATVLCVLIHRSHECFAEVSVTGKNRVAVAMLIYQILKGIIGFVDSTIRSHRVVVVVVIADELKVVSNFIVYGVPHLHSLKEAVKFIGFKVHREAILIGFDPLLYLGKVGVPVPIGYRTSIVICT